MQTTKLPQLRFLKSLEKFIILEVCKRTLCPKFGRLAPAAVILFFCRQVRDSRWIIQMIRL